MTWFRIDDDFATHPKVDALGSDQPLAVACWTLCGTACARDLTDGLVTRAALQRALAMWPARDRQRAVDALVRVGLWIVDPEGWRFHQWLERQPSRADVLAERARKARNKRDSRKNKRGDAPGDISAGHREVTAEVTGDMGGESPGDKPVSHHVPTRPDPTRPNHDRKRGGGTGVARETAEPDATPRAAVFDLADASPAGLVEVVWAEELYRHTEGRGGHIARAGDAAHLRAVAEAAQRCRGSTPLREFVAGWARQWLRERRSTRVRLEWWAEWCVEQAASVPVGHRLPSRAEYAEAADQSIDDLLAARAMGGARG